MVLTRRQLQEREQQQQVAMGDSASTTTGSKSSSTGLHHPSKTLQHQAMEVAATTKASQQQMNGQPKGQQAKPVTPRWVYILLVVFALLTILTIPQPFHPTIKDGPTVRHVFYYGWLTAMRRTAVLIVSRCGDVLGWNIQRYVQTNHRNGIPVKPHPTLHKI